MDSLLALLTGVTLFIREEGYSELEEGISCIGLLLKFEGRVVRGIPMEKYMQGWDPEKGDLFTRQQFR